MKLVIASNNNKKITEMTQILTDLGLEPILQSDAGVAIEPEETGTTFMENALIKARAVALASGIAAIADDSGLVVDALGGEPGIYSARYGADSCRDDTQRYELVLEKMKDVHDGQRTARFVCAIACILPDGETVTAKGACEGFITREPRGEGGFGYDPIFYLPEYDMTIAQISSEIKNRISHRAEALRNFEYAWKEGTYNANK